MGLAKNKQAYDFSWLQAQGTENGQVNTGISAAGSTQATATALTACVNLVSTATSLQGVLLYDGQPGDAQWVFNDNTGVTIIVYPPNRTGTKINGLGAGSGVQLANNTYARFEKVTSSRWLAIVSA